MSIETIKWVNGCARIIDQTKLPNKFEYTYCRDVGTMWRAIKRLSVRGAPAIGVAAAFGVLLAVKDCSGSDRKKFLRHFYSMCDYIGSSRPTAVNLFNALDEMKKVIKANPNASIRQWQKLLKKRAFELYEEDRKVCRKMGKHGAKFIKSGKTYLTVCNAGALATVDYGTALGVFYAAKEAGKKFKVISCETRPLLQGARLTTWELLRSGIDTTLICDNMAATMMKQGRIDGIFAGADRIALNGDAANKIGTYSLAVLAKHHKIPFYIVAPLSTFDRKTRTGKGIPIEERRPEEVTRFAGVPTAPKNVKVYNPAFDVTPNELIAGIVTEKGVLKRPFSPSILKILK